MATGSGICPVGAVLITESADGDAVDTKSKSGRPRVSKAINLPLCVDSHKVTEKQFSDYSQTLPDQYALYGRICHAGDHPSQGKSPEWHLLSLGDKFTVNESKRRFERKPSGYCDLRLFAHAKATAPRTIATEKIVMPQTTKTWVAAGVAVKYCQDHGGRLPNEQEWAFLNNSGMPMGDMAEWTTPVSQTRRSNGWYPVVCGGEMAAGLCSNDKSLQSSAAATKLLFRGDPAARIGFRCVYIPKDSPTSPGH